MINKKGFTLIELLMVVATIAVIAAIAIPSYLESIKEARFNEARSIMMQIAQGNAKFINDYRRNGWYLETSAAALSDTSNSFTTSGCEINGNNVKFEMLVKCGYMQKINFGKVTSFSFYYCNPSTGGGASCCAVGRYACMTSKKVYSYRGWINDNMEYESNGVNL